MLNVTTENQKRADERLPILINTPAKHRGFMATPYIGPVDAAAYALPPVEWTATGIEGFDGLHLVIAQ